ncbi:hypothetical protein Asppvi_mt00037 (mitochondrion) [Aspergillus pseudoviridinutans]|nr:hypothetical protein Asppvi_mt00037 [Aspergillus pseudoviridinutans]
MFNSNLFNLFNPFHLVSPSPWPQFTNISLFNLNLSASSFKHGHLAGFDNMFVGSQNILSSLIVNNLSYCYLFLIFIFSILLTILLFILVTHIQKGYSVKMNNLPKNENSKKRKRKSENENSKKKGKSGNGDSGDSGSPKKNKFKLLYYSEEDEETKFYNHYMEKYYEWVAEDELCPRGTINQVEDSFLELYSEYKRHKVYNPELQWEKLTEIYFSTWDKQPFGNKIYADTDRGFEKAFEFMVAKRYWIDTGFKRGKVLEASGLWKKALANVDYTTFEKYINILNNLRR